MNKLALLLPLLALAPLAAGAAGFRLVEAEELAKLDEERAKTGDDPAVTVDGTVVATKNRLRFVVDPTRSRNLGTVDFLLQWAPREPFVAEPSPFAWTVAGQYADDRFAARCIADAFLLDREAKKRGFESREAMVRDGIAEPTDDEIRKEWDRIVAANPESGRRAASAVAVHVLAACPLDAPEETVAAARAKIDKARARILAGEDFAAVAHEMSDDPCPLNGDEGFRFSRGQVVPEYETAAFSQEIGAIGEPFRTDFGWFVVRVKSREPERDVSIKEVRDDLKTDLFAKKFEDRIERLLEPLRKAAVIQYAPGYDPAEHSVLYWNPATQSSATNAPATHANSAEGAKEPAP